MLAILSRWLEHYGNSRVISQRFSSDSTVLHRDDIAALHLDLTAFLLRGARSNHSSGHEKLPGVARGVFRSMNQKPHVR